MRRARSAVSTPLWLALAVAGCGQALPSPALVNKLRLLAMAADTPDVAPGASIHVQAVWFDGSVRAGRPVYFQWRICADGADGDPRSCLLRNRGNDLGPPSAGLDQITLQPTDFPASSIATDPTMGIPYTLLLAMCPDMPPAFDDGTMQYQCPSEQSIAFADREGIQATRSLRIFSGMSPNANPPIDHVTIAGQRIDMAADAAVEVIADAATVHCGYPQPAATGGCVPSEVIVFPAAGAAQNTGSGLETILASVYVTAGGVDKPRAVASPSVPDGNDGSLAIGWFPPGAGVALLWVVLRDGTGGETVLQTPVNVVVP